MPTQGKQTKSASRRHTSRQTNGSSALQAATVQTSLPDLESEDDERVSNKKDPADKAFLKVVVNGVDKAFAQPLREANDNPVLEAEDSSSLSDLSDSEHEEAPKSKGKGKAKPARKGTKAGKSTTQSRGATKPTAAAIKAEKGSRTNVVRVTDTQTLDEDVELSEQDAAPPSPRGTKRKRKTAAEKEAEAMPLAARTTGLRMFVGAHTSIAKGVENAITNAVHIGGNSFACFLKSQRKWDNPSLQEANRDAFKQHLITHRYDAASHIVPHGSYLVNLATEVPELAQKSYNAFIDDLKRCEALGIRYYNFHPGAAGKATLDSAIARLAANLNRALSATSTVVPLLENMASRGSVIGGRFSDLASVIALIEPQHRDRIGVCIDTCHAFASGYDLRTPNAFKATLTEFDETVGIKYLKALHLNDSKAPLGSGRDLHQNIGFGFLGLRAFHNVMNEPRFENLPLILETPCEKPDPKDPKGKKTVEDKSVWAKEIKLLESLIGMPADGEEFKKLEKDLANRGKEERVKYQKAWDEKLAKEKKKADKEREKGQKSVKDMFGGGTGSKAKSAQQKRGMATAAAGAGSGGGSSSELSEPESDVEAEAGT